MLTRRQAMVGAAVAGVALPVSAAIHPNRREQFIGQVRQSMAANKVPGLALAIVENGKLTVVEGFGVRSVETRDAVDGDTLFRAGSVGKPMTALTMLRLAEAGKVRLDTPVAHYLPHFRTRHVVTVRQLLNQTSGFSDGDGRMLGRDPVMLDYLKNPLAQGWEPGRFFSYSNPGFAIAGAVVEAVGNEPFAVQARRTMAAIGMPHATFDLGDATTRPHTVGHELINGRLAVLRPEELGVYHADMAAGGSFFASARDLGRFAEWLLAGTKAGLANDSFAEMTTPGGRLDAIALGYGLGLGIDRSRRSPAIGHGGSISGYRTSVYVLPEQGFGMAILTNRPGRDVADVLVDHAFETLAGVAVRPLDPSTRRADQLGLYQFTRLDGVVRQVEVIAAGQSIAIRSADGVLGPEERSLRPDVYGGPGSLRVFVRDGRGQVIGMNSSLRHRIKVR